MSPEALLFLTARLGGVGGPSESTGVVRSPLVRHKIGSDART